jgi:hypothetical protein
MPRVNTRIRTLFAGALLSAAVLVPVGASSASASGGDLGERLRAACMRIPNAQTRTTTIITRLEATADVRGSLSWFTARIAEATATNHPRVAADLQHRADVLVAKLALVHLQADRLATAADYCRTKGVPL